MIKEAFGKGATTEAAIEAAKAELNAPWDADVQVELVKAAKKKTFGLFGGSLAEARAFYEVPDEKKEVKKDKPKAKAPAKQKAQESKPAKNQEESLPKTAAKETAKSDKADKEIIAEDSPAKEMFYGEASKKAEAYIRSILEGMGVEETDISVSENDDSVVAQLNCGNDYGYIIGRRGETLDAIQYLTRLVINKGSEGYKRVSINAGNYREKREATLRELAKKNASKVRKYGRNVCLDPMNPYERRIIHTTIQDIEGVDSHSIGSESDRRVVITLAEGFKATNPGRNSSRRNDYRRRDNSNKKPAAEQPAREPRSDSASVNLYGKIEPKNKEE